MQRSAVRLRDAQRARRDRESVFSPRLRRMSCRRRHGSRDMLERFQVIPDPLRARLSSRPGASIIAATRSRGRATGDAACLSCHLAKQSKDSSDLMLPQMGKCEECHGDRPALERVAVQCVSCHSYHPQAHVTRNEVDGFMRSADRQPFIVLAGSLVLSIALAGCSGGDPVADGNGTDTSGPTCSGSCASASASLTVADVQQVLAQGIAEARARNANATLAVVDRVGNVLAVYRMGAATARTVTITSGRIDAGNEGGLEGLRLPVAAAPVNIDHAAAISKAITGAYLSSEGNAFSTRTASQIVQQHFNPGERFQPSGPLFGVQFSQLACSDLMRSFDGVGPSVGPQRSPLGLAADPGGFPLYKSGTVVGGIGVIADGTYGLDLDITTATTTSTRPLRMPPRLHSPLRSTGAVIASPPTARRCGSRMSSSIASRAIRRRRRASPRWRRQSGRWSPCQGTSMASFAPAPLSVKRPPVSVPTATSTIPARTRSCWSMRRTRFDTHLAPVRMRRSWARL